MTNWKKTRNYRKHENSDGSFTYTILVNGKAVEVGEDVYTAFATTERKMEYMELDLKRDRVLQDADGRVVRDEHGHPITLPEREMSLDKLLADDWDYQSPEPLTEEAVIGQMEVDTLRHFITMLEADEQALITALFYDGMTEREYAAVLGITQKAVNKRKFKVLGKLKKLFSDVGTQRPGTA